MKETSLKGLASGKLAGCSEATFSDARATGFRTDPGIVVGGGLAGVSAANTLLENGGKVVLVDKSSYCGGNSTPTASTAPAMASRWARSRRQVHRLGVGR